MKTTRNALLGACLALPLLTATGHAQTTISANGRTITIPPGAVVLIVPGPGFVATPSTVPAPAAVSQAAPILQMIAAQQAAMQHMMAQVNAMFPPMPDPSQLLRAAFGAGGPMLTAAGGPGVCSESISIVQRGNSAPVITRTRSAGCGAPVAGKPANVRDIPPAPAAPHHTPQVLDIGYPPHAVPTGIPPRT